MSSIQYIFSTNQPNQQYIAIQVEFVATKTFHEIQLPAWRPGRYELGNFAKNVRDFVVYSNDKIAPSEKKSKDCWAISTIVGEKYVVSYQYYAAELNAGSSLLNDEQLYVNPVNCCVFIKGMEDLPCSIQLNLPEDYEVATSLRQSKKHHLEARNFDELADSPWIASNSLQHDSYEVENTRFHFWFQGECRPDFQRLKNDFSKFTQEQWNRFGEFPFDEYHFLFQIVPFHAYHGVEHLKSTVIYLGASFELFANQYKELLGVSSHELYHSWNVKTIRPIELFPYDFTKENYSKLGYLCEGVTTYMGDLMLLRSQVFSLSDFLLEMNVHLQKHFHNSARFHTSVADSSFDTWLDGYVPGAPGRKVSIYTEGALLSLAMDILILSHTNGEKRLDDVMKDFYENIAKQGKGVSEADFWSGIQQYIGTSEEDIWKNYYHGSGDFEVLLKRVFALIGMNLIVEKPINSTACLGIKTLPSTSGEIITSIYPQSEADKAGLMINDEIIAVNNIVSKHEVANWISYFGDTPLTLTIIRAGKLQTVNVARISDDSEMYHEYSMVPMETRTAEQTTLFEAWRK